MKYDPQKHHRRSIRLKGYDYTQAGAYFVTICGHNRECLFGEIVDGEMRVNEYGKIVVDEWTNTACVRANVELDEFVLMPNHMHSIIVLTGDDVATNDLDVNGVGASRRLAPITEQLASTKRHAPSPGSLGAIMAQFKSIVTKRINTLRGTQGAPVWQRNYYENIIRNEKELERIRKYITNNPANWAADQENPSNGNKAK
ncbi:hypothetical protein ANRL1_01466 [Anaerolineae bacterium]|nr:hypothetical protein ANRL1_01466 [Anaerolineae bacterium]